MNIPPGFISEFDMAVRLNKNVGTLRRWRSRGYGPKAFKRGKEILYRENGEELWLNGVETEQPSSGPRPRLTEPNHGYSRRGRPRKEDGVSA
jgi:hypothetical protein